MGQPITTNPVLIAAINMTVVFAVLYGLSLMIRLITLIDPTQKKKVAATEVSAKVQETTVIADAAMSEEEEYDEMILLFTAAIAAYGHSGARIVAIRPVGVTTWSQTARVEGVSLRNGMF